METKPVEAAPNRTDQNIGAVLDFYTRAEQKISRSQRILEHIGNFMGQPLFLSLTLLFVALWMFANALLRQFGTEEFDPAPYLWLQGIVGLSALLTTTVVLTKQNRLAKLIDLMEELRRDLPNVKNRHDSAAVALQQSMNPDLVLAALDGRSEPDGQATSVEKKPWRPPPPAKPGNPPSAGMRGRALAADRADSWFPRLP